MNGIRHMVFAHAAVNRRWLVVFTVRNVFERHMHTGTR